MSFPVDSVGKYNPDSVVIVGSRYAPATYYEGLRTQVGSITFRPAVLYPDNCAVPGTGIITFRFGRE
jgi:hypothetical protein